MQVSELDSGKGHELLSISSACAMPLGECLAIRSLRAPEEDVEDAEDAVALSRTIITLTHAQPASQNPTLHALLPIQIRAVQNLRK
ncbi:MAG TPA: hypothetical protein DEW46_08215 [Verrucomicrobia bacterium]|nr:hypothetical protein [Verrucomicrobiota bacterium]